MVGFQGIEGDFHVDPAADAVGNLRAVHHVPENAFPATAVEPGDRMSLSFGIGGKAQPLLQRRLHGQATGLSSILVCHPVTLHGPVSRDYIPEHAVQNVLDARAAAVTVQICGDLGTIRPLVEGQPSTEFPLQTVSVPSNVNSYLQLATVDFSRTTKNGVSGRWSIQRENTSRSRQYSEISASCSEKLGCLETLKPVISVYTSIPSIVRVAGPRFASRSLGHNETSPIRKRQDRRLRQSGQYGHACVDGFSSGGPEGTWWSRYRPTSHPSVGLPVRTAEESSGGVHLDIAYLQLAMPLTAVGIARVRR